MNTTSRGLVPSLGAEWPFSSLIWGQKAGSGKTVELHSPVDKTLIQRVNLLSEDEIQLSLAPRPVLSHIGTAELKQFCGVCMRPCKMQSDLLETTQLETGFTRSDCEEVLEGVLAYVRDFPDSLQSTATAALPYDCWTAATANSPCSRCMGHGRSGFTAKRLPYSGSYVPSQRPGCGQ
jgi:hypothetical protein